jgi:hypothetical protein
VDSKRTLGWGLPLPEDYHVTAELLLRYRDLMLKCDTVTEEIIARIWPRPVPPDRNYEDGGFYPHHLLHHKFNQWNKRRTPETSIISFVCAFTFFFAFLSDILYE